MKKVYVVKTSSDGVLGVYSNVSKVWEKVGKQELLEAENSDFYQGKLVKASYQKACKAFKESKIYTLCQDESEWRLEIEEFYMNE